MCSKYSTVANLLKYICAETQREHSQKFIPFIIDVGVIRMLKLA